MQSLLATIQQWHIHPVIDHFTVAIFVLAVITDLVASLFSSRPWLRYAALALTIVAAGAAWGSSVSGGWEADKVWKAVKAGGGPAFAVLQRHAELGDDILPWVITALAVWRIGVQALGFIASSRPLYLLVAIAALVLVSYQGYLGGELVYDYGVGTAAFGGGTQAPAPAATETPSGPATPIPTVFVPAAAATPSAPAAPAPSASTPPSAGGGSAGTSSTPSAPPAAAEPSAPAAPPSPAAAPGAAATAGGSASSKADDLKASSAAPGAPGTTIRPPDPHTGATSL